MNILKNYDRINVILDTDTYNECDDEFALAYMINSQDLFNINAITIAPFSHPSKNVFSKDSQELSYQEVLKICNWLNFDTTNKVFKGSIDYLQNGYNGDNDAVLKIIELSLKNDKTYIMAIGAITNVALAIRKEPRIIHKIEVIWLGGNEIGYKDNLEYNFKQDVEAVKVVLNSKVKLTVIPCQNVASNLRTSIYELAHFLGDKSGLNQHLLARFYCDGFHGIQEGRVLWDISVIAYLINQDWFITQNISCPNVLDDMSYEFTEGKHEITFVTYIDVDKVYKNLFRKLGDNNE